VIGSGSGDGLKFCNAGETGMKFCERGKPPSSTKFQVPKITQAYAKNALELYNYYLMVYLYFLN
jgi:hypothetical protein